MLRFHKTALFAALTLSIPTPSNAVSFGVIEVVGNVLNPSVSVLPAPIGHFNLLTAVIGEEVQGNGPWEVRVQVIDLVPGTNNLAVDKSVVNGTGFPFTNFQMQIIGDGVSFTPDGVEPQDVQGNFNTAVFGSATDPKLLTFTDGILPNGENSDFWLPIEIESSGLLDVTREFTIRQLANVSPSAIPEPTTWSLLGLGLLGILALCKQRAQR